MFKYLVVMTILVFLLNAMVNANDCCNVFDTNCCGTCRGGDDDGKGCSAVGSTFGTLCGSAWCPNFDKGPCDIGYKC
jgi:hypothetical protein